MLRPPERLVPRVTSPPNLTPRRFPSSFSLIFLIQLLPCPVQPTGFSFGFFPGFLAFSILVSANSNNNNISGISPQNPNMLRVPHLTSIDHTDREPKPPTNPRHFLTTPSRIDIMNRRGFQLGFIFLIS